MGTTAGRLAYAKEGYLQILQEEPKHYDANRLLGMIALAEGHLGAAAKLIAKAILATPHLPMAYQDLANVLLAVGRFNEAIIYFRDALQIDPAIAECYSGLANGLYLQGHTEEALQACQQAFALKPECPSLLFSGYLLPSTTGTG